MRRERAVLKRLTEAVRSYRPNLVFSFSNPQESNVLGARLARVAGLPFVSHFSDPWSDNPYKRYGVWRKHRLLRKESGFVRHSQRVVFTNESALRLVMSKYPVRWSERAVVVPHCFDPRLFPDIEPSRERFVMSYIGAFYGERSPAPLLAALAELFVSDPGLRDRFSLTFVGATDEQGSFKASDFARQVREFGLADVVSAVPRVEYLDSLRLMRAAHLLVAIDADYSGSPFLPSKVVDYAGSGRPIIGITPDDSPTAQFLERLGYRSFRHGDVKGLAVYLRQLIMGEARPVANDAVLREYTVQATTAKLLSVFRDAIQEAAATRR